MYISFFRAEEIASGVVDFMSEASNPDAIEWVELLCAAVGELIGVWASMAALTMDSLIQVDTDVGGGPETGIPETGIPVGRDLRTEGYMASHVTCVVCMPLLVLVCITVWEFSDCRSRINVDIMQ